ncbi:MULTISPECIES: response regulator transcription factor [Bacillaceae]|uniref:response regulator transcription factor n=1 Tax=Bacillaceae TaxID=186817 RepID=UPI000BFC340A|nr:MULTISPECIES: response regulator transcription factor [Bacillaceae]PGT84562.1 DNA-binding response regulator [Bacillus sp. AFS040349]UGB33510.1 response regulator transcription factor [Metabacillus sp. B2-18]
MKDKILIVDDEWNMRNLIKIHLLPHFDLEEAANGKEALEKVKDHNFQLIILDVMMPDMTGWTVCERIREKENIPILMLTALTDVKDKVHGLNIGADDYLVKPFNPEELVARVHALLRRSVEFNNENDNGTITISDLTIIKDSRLVLVNGKEVDLTPKEFNLIHLFATNQKQVFTREILLNAIWNTNNVLDVRTVDTHVKNVREKLRKNGLSFNPIKTVWGVGYIFQTPDGKA